MIITRDIINKNITYKDFSQVFPVGEYNYDDIIKETNMFKNLLVKKYNCQIGEKILIGFRPGIMQTALIFAAAELGLKIAVVDYNRNDSFMNNVDIDPKTKLLMPFDYFFLNHKKVWSSKISLLSRLSRETIFILEEVIAPDVYTGIGRQPYGVYHVIDGEFVKYHDIDYSSNLEIRPTNDSIFMICTSSGTTGTPKVIEHTHRFIYDLSHRNKNMFYGKVGITTNLQHGSSFATYFLPAIVSTQVESIYNIFNHLYQLTNLNLDHLMFPYTMGLETVVNLNLKKNPQLNLYTLNYIKEEWKTGLEQEKFKDIISIFGSNETSGPVFINRLSDPLFEETRYTKMDDFYGIDLDEQGSLSVTLPVYDNKIIHTNDKFKLNEDGSYTHLGRNDLIRINHLTVDTEVYKNKVSEFLNGDLIYDTVRQEIYLAIWDSDEDVDNKVETINKFIYRYSTLMHQITKYKILNYEDFLTGVKLDHELLREYFRNQP
jgi:hypothetical protein